MCSRMERWFGRTGSLALVAGLLLSGTSALAQQVRDELLRAIVLVDNENQPSEHYWIGIQLSETLPDAVRAQLELPEGQGVLVEDVMPDSPAAQAGLKKHDVIVLAGNKALTNPQDLVDAVAQAKESELSLQLHRSGKKLTLTVKPAKRPVVGRYVPGEIAAPEAPAEVDAGKLQELIQQFMRQNQGGSGGGGAGGMRVRMLQPGMVLPPGAPMPAIAHPRLALPENLSISISRQGAQPVKISVKQDDKSWDLTEDKLQELPDDVRMHVERMLGRMPPMAFAPITAPMRLGGGGGGAGGIAQPPVRVEIVPPNQENPSAPGQPRFTRRERPESAGVERRLDELNKQIHELREAIEKLQKQSDGGQK
ncbi:MAG TPA: PDZ domain-containing protein [Pirellulales bacterium]|nr:PDZ domain-containing protein [Pirellulales bacterium]